MLWKKITSSCRSGKVKNENIELSKSPVTVSKKIEDTEINSSWGPFRRIRNLILIIGDTVTASLTRLMFWRKVSSVEKKQAAKEAIGLPTEDEKPVKLSKIEMKLRTKLKILKR